MNRKGASNIEFVLSFILFAGFVVSALYFFNPTTSSKSMTVSGDYASNEIIKNTSVELSSYSVVVSSSEIDIMISLPGADGGKGVKVEDYNGRQVPSKRYGDEICVMRESSSQTFLVMRFSEDIQGISGPCTGGTGYEIASSTTDSVISEKRIKKLNEMYNRDYAALKKQLDMPENIDFSFSLVFSNGDTISAERNKPARAEVFSQTKIEEILMEDGTSQFGRLTVSIW